MYAYVWPDNRVSVVEHGQLRTIANPLYIGALHVDNINLTTYEDGFPGIHSNI